MNLNLVLIVAIPFVAGLLVVFPGRFLRPLRWVFALLAVVGSGLAVLQHFLVPVTQGFRLWRLLGAYGNPQFVPDRIGLVLAAVFLFLWLFVFLYSFGFFTKETEADTEFYALALFMLGSSMGLLFAKDLVFLYLFWEIAAVATWRLVGFNRDREGMAAAAKTILINFVGSAFMLVGFLLLSLESGSFNLADMSGMSIAGNPNLVLAGIFILAGIFAKSAVIPLYIWVPAAYAASPAPVVALLAGAIESFGLIVYMKIFVQTIGVTVAWQFAMLGIAFASAVLAGGVALVVKDYRRILGYSTVSQLAFVLAGFAVVGWLGNAGAVLFIVAHGLGKAALLLGYGAVEARTGERDITKMGGLASRFPLVFLGVVLATLSIVGLPPLLGFFAKIDVLFAVLGVQRGGLLVGAGLILASILTLLYMLRLLSRVFLRSRDSEWSGEMRQPVYLGVLVLVLSLTLLGSGIILKPVLAYLGGG